MRQAAGAAAEAQQRIESLEADLAHATTAGPVDSSDASDLVHQLQVECEQLRATLSATQAGETISLCKHKNYLLAQTHSSVLIHFQKTCCIQTLTAQVRFDVAELSAREDELGTAAEKAARAMDEV